MIATINNKALSKALGVKQHGPDIFEIEMPDFDCSNSPAATCWRGQHHTLEARQSISRARRINNGMFGKTNITSFKAGHKLRIWTPDQKKLGSVAKLGKNNPMYGNKKAADHMNVTAECPRCHRTMSLGNIARYHGERCKHAT